MSEKFDSKKGGEDDPRRFVASRRVLAVDFLMTYFIRLGGAGVIVTVVGIFIFILAQVLPLFQGARVSEVLVEGERQLPEGEYVALATDEWAELPMVVKEDGWVYFIDLKGRRGVVEKAPEWLGEDKVSAIEVDHEAQVISVGTESGQIHLLKYAYEPEFVDEVRTIKESLKQEYHGALEGGAPVRLIALGQSESVRVIATVAGALEKQQLRVQVLKRKRSLMGVGKWNASGSEDLSDKLPGDIRIEKILMSNRGDALVVVAASGRVSYFFRGDEGFELRQQFVPFEDQPQRKIVTTGFLLGDVSLVFVADDGSNRVFSLFRSERDPVRKFYHTKTLASLGAGSDYYARSSRNKAFLLGAGKHASLRFSTSEKVRWSDELPWKVQLGVISGKYDALIFLNEERELHKYQLNDPHPEAGLKAFFGKVWYEGAPEPKYEWQSTGGSDDFEPKFSLVPLIFGSLKGTLYAMLFAVPIALFGALYTSEFLHPKHKVIIKPVMEIMASLPSVVLGFMAALWLAPLIEDRVPSLLLVVTFVPLGAFVIGWFWGSRPMSVRKWIPQGLEFLYFMPVLMGLAWLGWILGPHLEHYCFTVTDPQSGKVVADFSQWWPQVTGTSFQQRNSLVVGFMMGFTVIPIVFTIAEDALSNVPGSLRTGSLAIGASRWQTAWRIVLPTASAGIFSGLMVGLGRAVGETMIVVMATGNTPIMEWNVFSGMRTLSANIAVELPEAPQHSTLYRTLFLGAFVLFLLTFVLNTIAELLRQHLRERYKTV
ncbi:MAG: ABC transporter permease subunit [Verrucomicrobiales bacterium]|nr:ABC transporter permease subunit [Verrucomicrobiales bacterium]